MRLTGKNPGKLMGLALLLLLAWIAVPADPARGAAADLALFYDALAPYGAWVNYGHYGPVWYPTTGVTANWRPYVDGRWLPSAQGWIFETSEPWGWATYHFGNWMPTTEYGWVWVPGSTWYPSTTAWRTSDDYIGWAPIPPPDFVPPPAYYPYGGYYSGIGLEDLLCPPFWIFVRARFFLRGFGSPFFPSFSFANSAALAPFHFVPVLFPGTVFESNFVSPVFAPRAFFAFGPPLPFVARVANIDPATLRNFAESANLTRWHNVLPPAAVTSNQPFIRAAIPAAVLGGAGFQITRVTDPAAVQKQLVRPGVVPPPANLPQATREIPRVAKEAPQVMIAPGRQRASRTAAVGSQGLGLPKGMALPPQSEHALTPAMRRQIRQQAQGTKVPSGPPPPPLRTPAPVAPRPGPAAAFPRSAPVTGGTGEGRGLR
ncbi:MAG: DUF6600 domain-containing protein [Desulfobaccales bacterium]